MFRKALIVAALATALVSPAAAATNPIFGGAKATPMTVAQAQTVKGKGALSMYYGYYGLYYSYLASYYGNYSQYYNGTGQASGGANTYYYTAAEYSAAAYSYYYAAYYYVIRNQ